MAKSTIEWTDYTWNPVTGCSKLSDGCKNCYAERMAKRLKGRFGYPEDEPFRPTFHPGRWKAIAKLKKPSRIFVCSMGDLFHEDVPFKWIVSVMMDIRHYPQHTFIILTKRPHTLYNFSITCHQYLYTWEPLPNMWIGVSVENQKQAERRIPLLLQIPAAKRFISCEPMLEPIYLDIDINHIVWRGYDKWNALTGLRRNSVRDSIDGTSIDNPVKLDWVICGGESGPGARHMNSAWAMSLRDQCADAKVPLFFKGWGTKKMVPELEGKLYREFPAD